MDCATPSTLASDAPPPERTDYSHDAARNAPPLSVPGCSGFRRRPARRLFAANAHSSADSSSRAQADHCASRCRLTGGVPGRFTLRRRGWLALSGAVSAASGPGLALACSWHCAGCRAVNREERCAPRWAPSRARSIRIAPARCSTPTCTTPCSRACSPIACMTRLPGRSADSWNTPDGKAWTIKLKQGVQFHDGTEVTSDAVKFSIDRIKDPATTAGAQVLGRVTQIDSVSAPDKYTVVFQLKNPSATFPLDLADTMIVPTYLQRGQAGGHRSIHVRRVGPQPARAGQEVPELPRKGLAVPGRRRSSCPRPTRTRR